MNELTRKRHFNHFYDSSLNDTNILVQIERIDDVKPLIRVWSISCVKSERSSLISFVRVCNGHTLDLPLVYAIAIQRVGNLSNYWTRNNDLENVAFCGFHIKMAMVYLYLFECMTSVSSLLQYRDYAFNQIRTWS